MLKRLIKGLRPFALAIGFSIATPLSDAVADQAASDQFESHVRPVLVDNCVQCHGPDVQEGGLRLDSRAGMLRGGRRGKVVIAENAKESLLVHAIRRTSKLKMPPDDPLDPAEVAAIERWINAGAPWPQARQTLAPATSDEARFEQLEDLASTHWAFQPLRPLQDYSQHEVSDQSTHPIDGFIARQLDDQGLEPSPQADRSTLIRRLYFDLIGLPPSVEQTRAFVNDPSPDAFEALVDDLLNRREYGERWARHWLDVARYADTTGYQEGAERRYPFAWTYRDYVVRSLNEDTPFNEFIVEQLAADQLELSREEHWKLAAMGFLTLGPRFNYVRHEIIDDRIDTVTRGLLGLTVACARCHDHKYDPVLAGDYYSLYGVFASSREPSYADLPRIGTSRGDFRKYRRFRDELAAATRSFEQYHARVHRRIEFETRAHAADYLRYLVQLSPEHRTVVQPPFETERGIIRGPTPYGTGAVVRWQHYIDTRRDDDPVFGVWKTCFASSKEDVGDRWRRRLQNDPNVNSIIREALENRMPDSMLSVASIYGEVLEENYHQWTALLEENPAATRFPDDAGEQLRQVLYGAESPIVMNEDEAHDCYTSGEFDQFVPRKQKMDSLFVEFRDVAAPRAMIMVDRDELHQPRVFARGQATRPGKFVPRRFLFALPDVSDPEDFQASSGRLPLARSIAHPKNPLTPRVIVNRVWRWHFGRGLVDTPSDFGTRASPPSHPELLGWLAADFVEHGWSLKRLHKQMVTSATWKQTSAAAEKAIESDPDNRWLSHMNRRRLGFEPLRDSLLAVAGMLELESGGPPDDDLHSRRRSLYLMVNRDDLDDAFATFDFPSPDFSLAKRSETTVPQQALFLMNSDFVASIAENVCDVLEDEIPKGNLPRQIDWLYRRILTRSPSRAELDLVMDTLDFGDDEEQNRAELLGLAQVLLMSNEFLFVD